MTLSDHPGYIDSLLPTPEDEYDELCANTFTKRLAIMLVKNGTLSSREACDLFFPSHDLIEEADSFIPGA